MNTLPNLSSDGQEVTISIPEAPENVPKDQVPTVAKTVSIGEKIPTLKKKRSENELGSEKKVKHQKVEIPRLKLSVPSLSHVPALVNSISSSSKQMMRKAVSLRPNEGDEQEIRLRKTRSVSHAMNRLNENRQQALKHHQEMFEDLSLLSLKRRKAREYYPRFEYIHLRNDRINSVPFNNLSLAKSQKNHQMVKQLLDLFNSQLERCSSRKTDLTVEFSKKRLFSVCNEEIKLLLDQNPSSITYLSLSDSPRVKELAIVVEESGVLLYPIVFRLILLTSQLLKLHQFQGYYTAWSRKLYQDLMALIKPDTAGGFNRKKLDDFLKKFDELISSRGKKTKKILRHVLALNSHDTSPLIRYCRNWNCSEPKLVENFENLVKTSTWQNIKFSGLSKLKFGWFQSTAEKPCINQITLREIVRCFGNEDNGVVIIPREIRVGGKVVHDSSSSHHS